MADALAGFIERRKTRIGASDIAGALTGSFGVTPAAIVAGKLGLLDDNPPTERMRLGLNLEDQVIDAGAALLELTVIDRQVEVPHPKHHWLVATLDAVVRCPDFTVAPLEAKTTSNPDGYPDEYISAQLHVQMMCLGSTVGYSVVWDIPTRTLEVATHRLDPAIAAVVEAMGEELWAHLFDKTVPPVTFPADTDLWNRLHPVSTSGAIELPVELVENLRAARAESKAAANREELLEAKVKELLGDVDTGCVDGIPAVSWRTVISRRVDLRGLEADEPDLVEAHRVSQAARRFVVVSPIRQSRKAIP